MRSVKKIYPSVYAPIADLKTYRPMPTQALDHLDPFLFLNHHGPQLYPANNKGLPFGPHPHRGFETLTFILKGDIVHQDSSGAKSIIKAGGVQWMTAGSGLIHSEISSDEFKKKGGEEEVIQLWLNLKSTDKMVSPNYVGLAENELTIIEEDMGRVLVHLISGSWHGITGPVNSLSNLTMARIDMESGGLISTQVKEDHQILFYVVHGKVIVNGKEAKVHELVEFEFGGTQIEVSAEENSQIIFGHGKPFNEPIVAQGPFVMNSEKEIYEAYKDYQEGKMGIWQE